MEHPITRIRNREKVKEIPATIVAGLIRKPEQWRDGYVDTSGLIGVPSHFHQKRARTAHVVNSNAYSIVSIMTAGNVHILSLRKEKDMDVSTYTLLGYSMENQLSLFGSSGKAKSVVAKCVHTTRPNQQSSTSPIITPKKLMTGIYLENHKKASRKSRTRKRRKPN